LKRFDRLEFEEPEPRHPPQAAASASSSSAAAAAHELFPRGVEDERDEHHWIRVAGDERRGGLHENALRYYSRALELNKSLVEGWVGQVQMLIALGEFPEAELWSRKALELFRNNAELLAARAQALCRTGDLRGAQASCDAAIGQQGMFSYPWVARGELMLARRERTEEYCFDKAVQLDADWLVPLEIGSVYEFYGRHAKALTRTRQAVEKAPDQPYCWFRQGECELALDLVKPAEKSFQRCLQLAPKHENARTALWTISRSRKPIRRFLRRLFRLS
jgi:tetratricopeptide (TPR) repeat protein